MSVLAVVIALGVLWRADTDQVAAEPAVASTPAATPAPTASSEPAPAETSVAPPEPSEPAPPTVLSVDSLGVEMPIKAVGVSDDGQMVMPPNPADIGWYRFGPSPGSSTGAAVLAGHVDSKEFGTGPLAKLRDASAGDTIEVENSAGDRVTYRVETTEVLSKQTIALEKVFTRSGDPLLHVLTCGGAYLPDQGGYQDNVLVTARPI